MESQAFKKLGDALEQWHRVQRQIPDAKEDAPEVIRNSLDMAIEDQDVEHLPDDDAEAEGQALGAATDEQARALDRQAMEAGKDDREPGLPTRLIHS